MAKTPAGTREVAGSSPARGQSSPPKPPWAALEPLVIDDSTPLSALTVGQFRELLREEREAERTRNMEALASLLSPETLAYVADPRHYSSAGGEGQPG